MAHSCQTDLGFSSLNVFALKKYPQNYLTEIDLQSVVWSVVTTTFKSHSPAHKMPHGSIVQTSASRNSLLLPLSDMICGYHSTALTASEVAEWEKEHLKMKIVIFKSPSRFQPICGYGDGTGLFKIWFKNHTFSVIKKYMSPVSIIIKRLFKISVLNMHFFFTVYLKDHLLLYVPVYQLQ